jgi:hypothetical protein
MQITEISLRLHAKTATRPTHLTIRWLRSNLALVVKRSDPEINLSFPSTIEVYSLLNLGNAEEDAFMTPFHFT